MDTELWLYTIYNKEGMRVGMGVRNNLEDTHSKGKRDAEAFGGTFKTWQCTEAEYVEKRET